MNKRIDELATQLGTVDFEAYVARFPWDNPPTDPTYWIERQQKRLYAVQAVLELAWDEGMGFGVNYDTGDYETPPEPILNPYRKASS